MGGSANGTGGHDACAGCGKPFDLARPVGVSYASFEQHFREAVRRIAQALITEALREPT
jgi:hypothetical protein